MSFLDRLSANVTNAGKIVSQKAKNMSEASTLSSEQRAEKRNIQERINEIGRLYYEKYKDTADAEFAELMASITASEKRIEELQVEIEAIRAREPDLVPVPEDPKPEQPKKQPTAMVCMQCGRSHAASETTCTNCGQELIPQYGSFANAAPKEEEAAPKPAEEVKESAPAASESAEPAADAKPADAPESPVGSAPEEKAPEQPAPHFCAYCGKPCEAGQSFCSNCGQKL